MSCSAMMTVMPWSHSVAIASNTSHVPDWIELRRRFIQHEHVRFHGQHRGDGQPLHLSAGQSEWTPFSKLPQAQQLQRPLDTHEHFLARHAGVFKSKAASSYTVSLAP